MLSSISKEAIRIDDEDEALEKLICMQDCSYTSKGPVSIEIPIDIQRKKLKDLLYWILLVYLT